MTERAAPLLEQYDVRGGTSDRSPRSLSGGNQQKIVLARELAGDPELLIAAQPTRGLDVGAIEFVHAQIARADAGGAILLFSPSWTRSARCPTGSLVIYDGRFVGELSPDASEEEFGVAMMGGRREASAG